MLSIFLKRKRSFHTTAGHHSLGFRLFYCFCSSIILWFPVFHDSDSFTQVRLCLFEVVLWKIRSDGSWCETAGCTRHHFIFARCWVTHCTVTHLPVQSPFECLQWTRSLLHAHKSVSKCSNQALLYCARSKTILWIRHAAWMPADTRRNCNSLKMMFWW